MKPLLPLTRKIKKKTKHTNIGNIKQYGTEKNLNFNQINDIANKGTKEAHHTCFT